MSRQTGITFRSAPAFWVGVGCVAAGVLSHLPDFAGSREMHYHMSGMPMSPLMLGGMLAIVAGLALTAYGLIPAGTLRHPSRHAHDTALFFRTMDDARLTRAHWGLLFVLGIALVVDVMKPATLGFAVPGMKAEYGITIGQVATFPMIALTGTTLGSLLWGVLADRIGRRASILLASILFMGTSICGFMPSFRWNLFMCFIMGTSAGGMLPIVYALMTESMPAKKRGWLVVLHGGLGTVAGYLLASGLAALLEPHFSWRILWFAGLPTGFLLLALNHWIPESPRFLLEHGRVDEAEQVLARYGVTLTRVPAAAAAAPPPEAAHAGTAGARLLALLRPPLRMRTLMVGMYAFGWSLVNWGFVTFTPTILRDRGLDAGSASRILFWAALIAVPATVLVAYLYGYWSSRKTMTLFAGLAGGTLLLFAAVDPGAGGQRTQFLLPLMVLLLVGSGGIISMLSPYTAEVYPTRLRGTGSGFAAGASKVGGILAPPLVAFALLEHPGFGLVGVIAAAPVLLSMAMIGLAGIETRDRPLEEMQAQDREHEGSQTARPGRWAPGADTPPSLAERPATSHTRGAHAMSNHHEYLVVGAGPAGVQMGFYLERHGRDYLVLEGGSGPGAFYQVYPRHRTMISINKLHTGSDDPEFNLRHDWNSLLSDGQGPLFREHCTDFFPPADALLAYLQDFVARHGIRVRYHTRVARISRHGDGFAVETGDGGRLTCDRLVMATGLSRPYVPPIPGIELVEGYEEMSVDPADFVNQRVLVIGKGNSGFETANHLCGAAALIHIVSPEPVHMAWKTHYVGHLRAINNNFLDTYQLKSQNAVLDARIERIRRLGDGRLGVTFAYSHAEGEVEELPYDRVIRCTGFRFDGSVFDRSAAPALTIHDRFPALTSEWESVDQPGMFFAGTLMQSQGYRKATSGFIHGFRYNIRTLAHILGARFHGQPWPADTLPFEPEAVAGRVLQRVNRASDIWQQQSFLGDAVLVRGDGTVEWHEALPVALIREKHGESGRYFMLTLEFGKHNNLHDPFNTPRSRSDDYARAADSSFLHPIIREYEDGEQVSEHHIIEHLEARWEGKEHVQPLLAYFRQRIAHERIPVGRIVAAEEGELQPAAD